MPVFSHSRLSTYETCALQYRLRYIDKIDIERREGVEAFVGRRVHETLQYLHDRHKEGVLLTHQDVQTHLRNSWERLWHDQILIVRTGTTKQDYWNIAERCVTNYYRANQPFDQDQTVSTELAVIFVLDAERDLHIKGYIDRLARIGDGVYEIHDYKTSRRLPTQSVIDKDRQLAFYHMAINRMVPDARQVKLVWHYLAHDRKLRSSRTPEDLDRLRVRTMVLIERIDGATERGDFPATQSRLCDWCDYRPMCPAWNPVQESLTLNDYGS